ncbi:MULTISPECIES: cache domain-containing sensor histidine kinase [Paenibacillus]|uniref:histidine kinase n=1 Tax=Paenibacillus albilobatus TaxID=2716884 RepID=A0A920CBG5_9BACL|nr:MULTISPECIES: sensor histidine kinase [Paenibacillus]GIO33355.1 sensor histidine kinase YesM [Paenibacillus albilobatus]
MQKWLVSFKHMKIKNKLSLLIAFIVAMTFAFAILVQQYAFSVYDEQLYQKSSQVLHLSSSAIEKELERIEQLSFSIVTDTQVQSLLRSIATSDSDYDRLILRKRLVDRLLNYVGSEPSLYSIHVVDAYGVQQDLGSVIPIPPDKRAAILRIAAEANGEARWTYPDASDPALILSRDVRSYSGTLFDLKEIGTVFLRINMDRIVHEMAGEEGDLVMTAGTDPIYPSEPHFDPAAVQDSLLSGSGYFTQEIENQTYFIAYNRSAETGWTYLNVTPFNRIFKQIVFIKELAVIVFILIFAVAILWGIRFSRGLTRPIENLIARMKLAEKGNFAEANVLATDQEPPAMDELGLLHRTFRLMVERINALITENYASRLLIKETEFKALQAQINPHFLYNTLESINWMAKINKQTRISQMVQALAFLLRNAVSLKEPVLSLAEELEMVRNYVTIQKFRFEDRLSFRLDVEDKELSRKIPKLTLQPLLENAVHYALEPSVDACTIAIYSRYEKDAFCLVVEDDGPGMAPDTLELLQKGELVAAGNGIGLLNIDERIRFAFGEPYGVEIDSAPGQGTRVIIKLPKELEG